MPLILPLITRQRDREATTNRFRNTDRDFQRNKQHDAVSKNLHLQRAKKSKFCFIDRSSQIIKNTFTLFNDCFVSTIRISCLIKTYTTVLIATLRQELRCPRSFLRKFYNFNCLQVSCQLFGRTKDKMDKGNRFLLQVREALPLFTT